MNNIRKILCIVLVAALIFSITGCIAQKPRSFEESGSPKDCEKAVLEFIAAYEKNDFVKARKHLTDSNYSQGIFEFETEEKIEERFTEDFKEGSMGDSRWSDEQLAAYTTNLKDMYKNLKKYEIEKVTEDKGSFIVTIKYTCADTEKYNESLQAIGLKYQDQLDPTNPEMEAIYAQFVSELVETPVSFDTEKAETKTIVVVKEKDEYKIDVNKGDFEEIFANSFIKFKND